MQRTTPPGTHNPHTTGHAHAGQWDGIDPVIGSVGPRTPIAPASPAAISSGSRWDQDSAFESDALAALFLGNGSLGPATPSSYASPDARSDRESDTRDAHTPAARRSPAPAPPPPITAARRWIEAVVLGHLPILGSAWVASHAQAVCEQSSAPVGLAKLRAGHLSIELFGVPPAQFPPDAELSTVLASLSGRDIRWLVCTDAADEPSLVYTCQPDGVTMLTSADDAAIVGSYSAIKGLLEGDTARSPELRWPQEAELTIALAGASPQRAGAAGNKLQSAIRTFLGREVHIELCAQRIGPRPAQCIFRGAWDRGLSELIDLLRAAHVVPAASKRNPAVHPDQPAQIPEPHPAPPHIAAPPRGALPPDPHPTTPAPPVHATHGERERLATLIDGLTPIEVTCPYAPGVELARGAGGGLHLVASADALPSLTTASAWARAHASLLRAAIPGIETDADASITCHILTPDAAKIRRLLESELRVHLIVRGEVEGRPFTVSRSLN